MENVDAQSKTSFVRGIMDGKKDFPRAVEIWTEGFGLHAAVFMRCIRHYLRKKFNLAWHNQPNQGEKHEKISFNSPYGRSRDQRGFGGGIHREF